MSVMQACSGSNRQMISEWNACISFAFDTPNLDNGAPNLEKGASKRLRSCISESYPGYILPVHHSPELRLS